MTDINILNQTDTQLHFEVVTKEGRTFYFRTFRDKPYTQWWIIDNAMGGVKTPKYIILLANRFIRTHARNEKIEMKG